MGPRAARVVFPVGALIACLVVAGCGSSNGAAAGTQKKHKPKFVPTITMKVGIPGVPPGHALPRRYTCDGANVSLPVRWSGVPAGTAEVVVFVAALKPVHGKLSFAWAVAGLAPAVNGLSAGKLPRHAIVGRNSSGKVGYSLCPPKGAASEQFVVRVEALPHSLDPKRGFDPEALFDEAERKATAAGYTSGSYKRS